MKGALLDIKTQDSMEYCNPKGPVLQSKGTTIISENF